MRRKGSGLLLVFLMLFLLLPTGVLADSIKYDAKTQSIKIVCDDLEEGKAYSFIATRSANVENELTQDGLVYLNQFTASTEGQIKVLLLDQGLIGVRFYVGGEMKDGQSPRFIGEYGEITSAIQTPAMLKGIEEEAFVGGSFQAAYLGDVESIGSKAFLNCSELIYVQIRSMTTDIADDAFQGCRNLLFSCYEGSSAYQYASLHGYEIELIPDAE